MEERIDRVQRFAKIWWKSRADGNKSQEFMSLSLGVSKKTIQNWEKGISSPDLFQSSEWFRVLGLNPMHYYLEFLYPDTAKQIGNDDDLNKTLHSILDKMNPNEKENLLYVLTGDYGGSWRGILELMNAYCHLPLSDRTSISVLIKDRFEFNQISNQLMEPDSKLPSMEILENAINEGKKSAVKGQRGYTIQYNGEK